MGTSVRERVSASAVAVQPCVSVLIPVHNRVDLTGACLDSIFRHADEDIPVEIIVIDDCSTDGTVAYLRSLGDRVRVLRNRSRECFAQNMNIAAALARSDYLLLLNNDTEVTPFWLRGMLDAARRDPAIGVVGNRQLQPGSGRINHAGMAFDAQCRPTHLYTGKPADFPPANVSRTFQALTGACWLVPRRVFLELGGFDPKFRNGWEDVDFCLRARQRGYKVWYAADSVIYHHIASSEGRLDHESDNARYFAEKWRGRIVPDHEDYLIRDGQLPLPVSPPGASSAPAAATGSADLHLAVTFRHGNAFSWVISQLALACEEAGLRVSLPEGPIDASIEAPLRKRLRRMMQRPASARAQVKWSHYWQPYWEQEVQGRINAEIFCTNYRYGPQPVHALDRWMRHTVLNANRKLPASRFCLEALTELGVPEARCRVLPYGYSPEVLQDTGADERYRQDGFVFLALTNGNDPYRYGTDILLSAFSRAFAGRNDVTLVLKDYGGQAAGPLEGWLRAMPAAPRVVHLPAFLTKEALVRLYRGADAFVAPFRGEGFGMKVLDACAVGLPVLAPLYGGPADYLLAGDCLPLRFREVPVGACLDRNEGVVPGFARWAEVEVDDLVVRMREVADRPYEVQEAAERARARVLEAFSWARAAQTLTSALDEFERERDVTISGRIVSSVRDVAVSVIMPTFNRPAELQQTLQGYTRQILPTEAWEIVLSDDGSNYDVGEHVAPFLGRMQLRVVGTATNGGPGAARNRAIPLARGELVLFTGDDIVPQPEFLAEHVAIHRTRNDPDLAVLGHTDWHPDLHVTRLMRYITGDGGQQFAYQILRPHSLVSYGYFYTSNVSLSRSVLERQEELFSDKLCKAALEDVELGLRLARDGMRLLYAPEAAASHLHAMTDDAIFRRQYGVGRSLATYAMLHPQRIDQQHRTVLGWLEIFQHVLGEQPGFTSAGGELAEAASATSAWLDSMSGAAAALETVGPRLSLGPDWAARLVGVETAHFSQVQERLDVLRLHLAEFDGIADGWFGVARGAANPARDFLRVCLCGSAWSPMALLSRSVANGENLPALYRLVRRVRRHRLVRDWWDRSLRIPGVTPVVEAGASLLRRLP